MIVWRNIYNSLGLNLFVYHIKIEPFQKCILSQRTTLRFLWDELGSCHRLYYKMSLQTHCCFCKMQWFKWKKKYFHQKNIYDLISLKQIAALSYLQVAAAWLHGNCFWVFFKKAICVIIRIHSGSVFVVFMR